MTAGCQKPKEVTFPPVAASSQVGLGEPSIPDSCATTLLGSEKEQGSQQHSDFSESSVARHSASIVAFREAPDHQECPS